MTGTIRLHNYRNYRRFLAKFEPGINVVIGENGRGKTNLLEALFFLMQGKSMRAADAAEMIYRGEEEAVIEGIFELDFQIRARARISMEGKERERTAEERLLAVSFQPDDIWMVKGGPEARRKSLDEVVSYVRKLFAETSREYQRTLKQRNEAIRTVRRGAGERELIRSWNPMLCRLGSAIVTERGRIAKALEKEMGNLAAKWGKGEIRLRYYTSMGENPDDEEKILEKIEKMEDAEIRRGASLIGPHRDELVILLGGRNARRECSQGEQKLVTIMWRIAQARLAQETTGKKPLLLMDDCLSELDEGNRALLMREFEGWEQVIITSTDDMPEFKGAHKIRLNLEAGK